MKVLFLCSGQGHRMQPLSFDYPKSLIPLRSGILQGEVVPNLYNSLLVLSSSHLFPQIEEVKVVATPEYFKREDYQEVSRRSPFTLTECKVTQYSASFYNNSYSLRQAWSLSKIKDCLIIEGDIYLTEKFVETLDSQDYLKSFYCCTYRSHEWVPILFDSCTPQQEKRTVLKDSEGLAMTGVSYWTSSDCEKIYESLLQQESSDLVKKYWEDCLPSSVEYSVVNCTGRLLEYDTVSDLLSQGFYSPEGVAQLLSSTPPERTSSMTNTSFIITRDSSKFVLRLPRKSTERIVDREREKFVQENIVNTDVFINGLADVSELYPGAVKVTPYLKDSRVSSFEDIPHVLSRISDLHSVVVYNESRSKGVINLVREIEEYEKLYPERRSSSEYLEVRRKYVEFIKDNQYNNVVFCHRDLDLRNILITQENVLQFIDFEYSGYLNKYWDYSAYYSELCLQGYKEPPEKFVSLIKEVCNVDLDIKSFCMWRGVVDFIWSCWSFAMEVLSPEDLDEYINKRWWSACEVLRSMISQ